MEFREILLRAEEKAGAEKEWNKTSEQTGPPGEGGNAQDTGSSYRSGQKGAMGAEGVFATEGMLAAEHEFFWRLEDLKLVRVRNDRAFLRLETNLDARIVPLGRFCNQEEPAKILNISVGGVGIGTAYQCCVGEKLLIKVCLSRKRGEENLLCRVLRVEKKGVSGFVYGCQFMDQSDPDRESMEQKLLELEERMRGKDEGTG